MPKLFEELLFITYIVPTIGPSYIDRGAYSMQLISTVISSILRQYVGTNIGSRDQLTLCNGLYVYCLGLCLVSEMPCLAWHSQLYVSGLLAWQLTEWLNLRVMSGLYI